MANTIIRPEASGVMLGVEGRYFGVVANDSGRILNQKFKARRPIKWDGESAYITVSVRFDDECKNGHETFTITGDVKIPGRRDWETGGCIHDLIAEHFPELSGLIKWHLVSTDGPMHYGANTVYLAGDRDYRGLRKGEQKPLLRGGKPGAFCYEWRTDDGRKPYELRGCPGPDAEPVTFRPCLQMIEGEGKARELDHARSAAVWPEATDAELMQEPGDLRAVLAARLPGLLASFRADVEEAGLLWPVSE